MLGFSLSVFVLNLLSEPNAIFILILFSQIMEIVCSAQHHIFIGRRDISLAHVE